MAKKRFKLLDTVVLLENVPERNLRRGEMGTLVEALDPDVFEVEFCDDAGQIYSMLALRAGQLILLHNQGKPLTIAA